MRSTDGSLTNSVLGLNPSSAPARSDSSFSHTWDARKGVGEKGAWFRDSEGNLLGIGQPGR